ncbi:hypothetical protein R50345_22670 [Paenibacillus sp. FSL R5-0345]|uniref:outer membrane protein assembly factor BamB family protein n=1 Tax=Paenibacillus sp. FSL R5-0345 TaxID=1536770 RepID=UPI0004F70FA4|nr:PQQ-binding-like beta-propeller repeat protein [Paenibacillus sp. FSL R5-0345]AIQ37194.1 hypothetical protein R50345_22670 [Paenibacillus sp. FSL R5-0345]
MPNISKNSFFFIIAVLCISITGCSGNSGKGKSEADGYTNHYQDKLFKGVAKEEWVFKGGENEVFGQVLTTDENTYFSSAEKLYAVDTATGEERWSHTVNGQTSVPAVVSDIVLYTDSSGMHAVNKGTGEEMWEHNFTSELPFLTRPSITVVSSKRVFITDFTKEGPMTFKALDIQSGKEAWKLAGDWSLTLTPTVIKDKLYIPAAGKMLVVNEIDGKELHSFNTRGLIGSYAASDQQIVAVNISGNVASYDSNTGELLWEYDNELLGLPRSPDIILLKDKVLLTEKRTGTIIALDRSSGNEEWNKQFGEERNYVVMGAAITTPSVIKNTIYIGIFDGQDGQYKNLPDFSSLTAINEETGAELWHYPVDDYIMYPPVFVDGNVIVTNMNQTVTAYQGGENSVKEEPVFDDEEVLQSTNSTNTDEGMMEKNSDGQYDLKLYEGDWSTPGSDEMAFNLSFTDSTSGIITFYGQGEEDPQPFKYVYPDGTLMAKIGIEEKPTILILFDSGVLEYKDNEQKYFLERSGAVTEAEQEGELLISGFEGKWCDSSQSLCFDLELEDDSGGTLEYYQELEPYKESFVIIYEDGYNMVLEFEAASSQVALSLNSDKDTLRYESDFRKETLKRQ